MVSTSKLHDCLNGAPLTYHLSYYIYYTGEKKAPILTLVIGGNHEASNFFWELYHGGWLAPNIYFMGHAGCVQVNGVKIAGASGIFKSGDFQYGTPQQTAQLSLTNVRDIQGITSDYPTTMAA